MGTPIKGARVRFWGGRVGRVRGWGWEGAVRRRSGRRRVVVRGRCMIGFFLGEKEEVGFGERWNGVEYGFILIAVRGSWDAQPQMRFYETMFPFLFLLPMGEYVRLNMSHSSHERETSATKMSRGTATWGDCIEM